MAEPIDGKPHQSRGAATDRRRTLRPRQSKADLTRMGHRRLVRHNNEEVEDGHEQLDSVTSEAPVSCALATPP